jgi:hypothetical protein
MPGSILSQGEMWKRLTGDKILPTRDYRNEKKQWCGLLSDLVLFRLVAPPLQAGVVGLYLVQGV